MSILRVGPNPRQRFRAAVVTGADFTTNSTSFVDVTGLTFPWLAPNRVYSFEFHLVWTSSATSEGSNFSVNGPSTPTNLSFMREVWTSITAHTSERNTAYDGGSLHDFGPGAAFWPVHLYGTVENGANPGTLAMRFRTDTGGANTSTIVRGSYGVLIEHAT